jgi:hypothetical protein
VGSSGVLRKHHPADGKEEAVGYRLRFQVGATAGFPKKPKFCSSMMTKQTPAELGVTAAR